MDLQQTAAALARNGFSVRVFKTAAEAGQTALELIPQCASVGVGGSMTVKQMGLAERLIERGNALYWHWLVPSEKADEARRQARGADWYLLSANAVTAEGELVNIDGSCNRVAAMLSGPQRIIVLAGKNKLAADYEGAVERIKSMACPMNAKRLGLNTPCAVTGRCTDCHSPQRMCSATVRLHKPPSGREFYVFLIDEDLGY